MEWYETLVSATIALCGSAFNLLSLTYFARYDYESLGSKMQILLNLCDLVVCITSCVIVITELLFNAGHAGVAPVLDVLLALYVGAAESTAFSTCLLSVTRCLCLCFPFKKMNYNLIIASVAMFVTYILGREAGYLVTLHHNTWSVTTTYTSLRDTASIAVLTAVLITVLVSNTVTILKVRAPTTTSDLAAITRRAAITVTLVSLNFCFYNGLFLSLFCVFTYSIGPDMTAASHWVYILEFVTYRVLLPMNSATNPLVYLVRKQEMRVFVKELLWKREAVEEAALGLTTRI